MYFDSRHTKNDPVKLSPNLTGRYCFAKHRIEVDDELSAPPLVRRDPFKIIEYECIAPIYPNPLIDASRPVA